MLCQQSAGRGGQNFVATHVCTAMSLSCSHYCEIVRVSNPVPSVHYDLAGSKALVKSSLNYCHTNFIQGEDFETATKRKCTIGYRADEYVRINKMV